MTILHSHSKARTLLLDKGEHVLKYLKQSDSMLKEIIFAELKI